MATFNLFLRPQTAEDWEPYRNIICSLYESKPLKDVVTEMETLHSFKATFVIWHLFVRQ